MTKLKRLKSAWIVFSVNMLLFLIGILKGAQLMDLGGGIALVDAPIFVYIFGETFRPSVVSKDNNINKDE